MEEAKALFFEGVRLVETEHYQDALDAFEQSYHLNPKKDVLINIGMCHQALSQNVEALEVFERYLKEAGEDVPLRKREVAETSIEKLRQLVSFLDLKSTPKGATLMVDGVAWGTAPLQAPIPLTAGAHKVKIVREGFKPAEEEMVFVAGETYRFVPTLLPLDVPLKVFCDPTDGPVFIDGKPAGVCPLETRLAPGSYHLSLTPKNRAEWRSVITLEPENPITLNVETKPLMPPEQSVVGPEPVSRKSAQRDEKIQLASAISAMVIGMVGAASGIAFTVYGNRTYKEAESSASSEDGTWTTEKRSDCNKKLSKARNGAISGFAVAGVFLPLGIALLVRDMKHGGKVGVRASAFRGGVDVAVSF